MKKLIHREQGKKWTLPQTVYFENMPMLKTYFYEVIGYRPPKAGEWYLSGTAKFIKAYQPSGDMVSPYLVVKPSHEAVQSAEYVRGKAV